MRRALPLLFLLLLVPATVLAKDVYKGFLDESIPHHRAIKDTLALIEAHPDEAGLYNDLGCLIAWDGFWRDALRNFETAARLDPKDDKPLFNAGVVHAWQGEWGSAKGAFKKALKRRPGNWPAWWMLGYAEERLGNREAAVVAYKTSLRVDTSLFDPKNNPFALMTKLKGRVLVETYEKRLVRAAMPQTEQLEDPERIGTFLQRRRPPEASAAPAPTGTPGPGGTSPVITSVPSVSSPGVIPRSAPAGTSSASPTPPAPGALPRRTPLQMPARPVTPPLPGPGVAPTPGPPGPGGG